MERAAKFDPGFEEINKRYWDLQRNISLVKSQKNLDELVKERDQLYLDSFRNYSEKHLKNNGLDMNELFNNMSIKFRALDGSQTIWFGFSGKTENKTLPHDLKATYKKTYNEYEYFGAPLETIVISQKNENLKSILSLKYLTFFSHSQEQWRNFQAQIYIIGIQVRWQEVFKSIPWNIYYFISINSPNYLPDFQTQTFRKIDIREEINIRYSENRIQRLGKGYDTDCYDYDLDNRFGYYKMRSDCINDCYQKKMREICKVDRGLFMSFSLIRKDYLVNGNDKMLSCYDPAYNLESFSIKQDCEEVCKVECNFNYYSNELNSVKNLGNVIYIQHGEYPDIFVKHIPEMTLIGFICNFGGLLGMWLGLSLFGIFNDIFTLMSKIAYRKYINSINVKVNQIKVNNHVQTINNFVNLPNRLVMH